MSEKLKPCPFCGGEAEIVPTNNGNPFIVYCENCGLEFGLEKEFYHYQAVEDWNRRAPLLDNAPLTLEELRGMDGQPVWIVFDDDSATWFLVDAGNIYKPLRLANNWGAQITLEEQKGHIKAIYRRPPEEE